MRCSTCGDTGMANFAVPDQPLSVPYKPGYEYRKATYHHEQRPCPNCPAGAERAKLAAAAAERKAPTKCEHLGFRVSAEVNRLSEKDGGPVTGYSCDIVVTCVQCSLPFRWLGLKAGSHFAEPRVSVDAITLRAPIEPAFVTEILGTPVGAVGHG